MASYVLWSQKFTAGVSLARAFVAQQAPWFAKRPQRVLFVGMGGSAIAGGIVSSFCQRWDVPGVCEVDPCALPAGLGPADVAILVSCSGNTWEVLLAARALAKKGVRLCAVTRGGELATYAEEQGFPVIFLPKSSAQPREELGYFIGILMVFVAALGFYDTTKVIDRFSTCLSSWTASFHRITNEFVTKASRHKLFYIWGVSGDTVPAARRFVNQCNENCKIRATCGVFPELNHNLIVGFSESSDRPLIVIFVTDFLEKGLKTALECSKRVLASRGAELYSPLLLGDTWEEQVLYAILWADFASVDLGVARGVALDAVEIIEHLKRLIAQ